MPATNSTNTLYTEGQVILQKTICDRRHWTPGTKLVVGTPEGVLLKAAPLFPPTTHEQVFGSVTHNGRTRTLEEMKAAIPADVKLSVDTNVVLRYLTEACTKRSPHLSAGLQRSL